MSLIALPTSETEKVNQQNRWDQDFEANCNSFVEMLVNQIATQILSDLNKPRDSTLPERTLFYISLDVTRKRDKILDLKTFITSPEIPSPFIDWLPGSNLNSFAKNNYFLSRMDIVGRQVAKYFNSPDLQYKFTSKNLSLKFRAACIDYNPAIRGMYRLYEKSVKENSPYSRDLEQLLKQQTIVFPMEDDQNHSLRISTCNDWEISQLDLSDTDVWKTQWGRTLTIQSHGKSWIEQQKNQSTSHKISHALTEARLVEEEKHQACCKDLFLTIFTTLAIISLATMMPGAMHTGYPD